MAQIDVGGAHDKRNHDRMVPLIPFIDFLLCLIAFLLVTAVWSHMARINADARVPGPAAGPAPEVEKTLHLETRGERAFKLVWKQGNTVIDTIDVPRTKVAVAASQDFRHPELAERVRIEWTRHGVHRSPSDPQQDQAVLHTDNTMPFQDIVAVLDALQAPERQVAHGRETRAVPAFNVTFAVN